MKAFAVCLLVIVTLTGVAAPFQNLGFDDANTNSIGPRGFGPVSEMLPGWRLFNDNGEPGVAYNLDPTGDNLAIMYDRNFLNFGAPLPVEGYALGLFPGPGIPVTEPAPYHLSQIGEVAVDAKSIHFTSFASPFDLRINDQNIPLIYDYPPRYPAPLFNRDIPVPAAGGCLCVCWTDGRARIHYCSRL